MELQRHSSYAGVITRIAVSTQLKYKDVKAVLLCLRTIAYEAEVKKTKLVIPQLTTTPQTPELKQKAFRAKLRKTTSLD